MIRSITSKAAWVGRTASMVFGLALVMALVIGAASTAWSATGGNFILGKGNAATAITKLAGAAGVDGPMLKLVNNDADPDDTALGLKVQAGEAPMRVNSGTKVANLNADTVDGRDSAAFWQGNTYTSSKLVSGSSDGTTVDPATSAEHTCDSGDRLLSGGYFMDGTGFEVYADVVFENTYHLKWRNGATANNATVYVNCADF